jgi:hypothetical protein
MQAFIFAVNYVNNQLAPRYCFHDIWRGWEDGYRGPVPSIKGLIQTEPATLLAFLRNSISI